MEKKGYMGIIRWKYNYGSLLIGEKERWFG